MTPFPLLSLFALCVSACWKAGIYAICMKVYLEAAVASKDDAPTKRSLVSKAEAIIRMKFIPLFQRVGAHYMGIRDLEGRLERVFGYECANLHYSD